MMLKKYSVACGALASLAVLPGLAFASSNTISFQGEVAAQTCGISINGVDTSPVVLLPTVSTAQLDTSGKSAGATTFEVGVSGCTGSAEGMSFSTVFVGNQVTSAGNLGNTGTAGNVELQIVDSTGGNINFTNGFTGNRDLVLGANQTSASSTYTAQYFSTGVATPGSVMATMQYAISYL
ncbi:MULTISPECIES: fimbrial protein [Winslowiella]|uniref:fimbrial protein n=1 Tax=Winslowiella TaxID=2997349 RepID=UPI0036F29B52